MASTVSKKLSLGFLDGEGSTRSMNFAYALASPDEADVIAALDAIVTNNVVFKKPPVSKKYAKLITTTTEDLPISA